MKIISKLFKTAHDIISIISACLAIVLGLRISSRKQRYFASIIVIAACLGTLALSCLFKGFIFTTTTYTALSMIKHISNWNAAEVGWNWWNSENFKAAEEVKNSLISNNGIASFLNACNASAFGKVIQVGMLAIGTLMYIALIAIVVRSMFVLKINLVDSYLVRNRNSRLYYDKHHEFASTMCSARHSSKDMKSHHLYSVFRNEADVARILEQKMEFEAINRRRTAAQYGRG